MFVLSYFFVIFNFIFHLWYVYPDCIFNVSYHWYFSNFTFIKSMKIFWFFKGTTIILSTIIIIWNWLYKSWQNVYILFHLLCKINTNILWFDTPFSTFSYYHKWVIHSAFFVVSFYVQLFEVTGDCSFDWSSLFKLYFHKSRNVICFKINMTQ